MQGLLGISHPGRLGLCCILLAAAIACEALERREESYPSMAEARRAGVPKRGWLPDWLPDSATEVKVWYYVDGPDVRIRFRCGSGCRAFLERCCGPDGLASMIPEFGPGGRPAQPQRGCRFSSASLAYCGMDARDSGSMVFLENGDVYMFVN